MRAVIHIPAYLRTFADGQGRVEVEFPQSVRDALTALRQIHPGVYWRVLDETGQVRQHMNVFLDNENIRELGGLDAPATQGSEIFLLPAVSGGSA
jgi:sulfur-carrier protein